MKKNFIFSLEEVFYLSMAGRCRKASEGFTYKTSELNTLADRWNTLETGCFAAYGNICKQNGYAAFGSDDSRSGRVAFFLYKVLR